MPEAESRCPKCDSEQVIPSVRIVDQSYLNSFDLAVEVRGNPEALIFKDSHKGLLKAAICGSCGHVQLSVVNPKELWRVYRRARDSK